jgi:hypothetical protein
MRTPRNLRRTGLVAGALVTGLAALTGVHSASVSAAPAGDDLVRAINSEKASILGVNPFLVGDYASTADDQVPQALSGSEGARQRYHGPKGRLALYAHRRDGGVRVSTVFGPVVDSWNIRGAYLGPGYPLDREHPPSTAEQNRCPANTASVQTFSRLGQSSTRLACHRTASSSVSWSS